MAHFQSYSIHMVSVIMLGLKMLFYFIFLCINLKLINRIQMKGSQSEGRK